jgi:phosphatidylinositol-3,4,5-trisphosphate 3-phosphatase/dual-specificity protein phosphatase PTEN
MEQYKTTQFNDRSEKPAIVVHCKAGKGRTGMMISALLLFIGMYPSAETAINHYNRVRVIDDKGLTIASQKRYVKFLEGFLNIHLW